MQILATWRPASRIGTTTTASTRPSHCRKAMGHRGTQTHGDRDRVPNHQQKLPDRLRSAMQSDRRVLKVGHSETKANSTVKDGLRVLAFSSTKTLVAETQRQEVSRLATPFGDWLGLASWARDLGSKCSKKRKESTQKRREFGEEGIWKRAQLLKRALECVVAVVETQGTLCNSPSRISPVGKASLLLRPLTTPTLCKGARGCVRRGRRRE